jgi:hypothetical protein
MAETMYAGRLYAHENMVALTGIETVSIHPSQSEPVVSG